MATDNADLFEEAGRAWGVNPTLLQAVQAVESGGDDRALSPKGAQGRMQLMPPTARALGVTDTSDPAQSVFGAAKLLRQHLDASNGDVVTALRLYQGGPDRSGWGPQNAAYPGQVIGKLHGILKTAKASSQPTQQSPNSGADDPFSAAFGATPAQSEPSPVTAAPTAEADATDPFSAAFASNATPKAVAQPKLDPNTFGPLASDVAAQHLEALRAEQDKKTFGQSVQEAVAPAANTTYGDILPVAKDNTTGAIRLALPTALRSILQGGIELSQGPATGEVTPAATNALLSLAGTPMMSGVARGSGGVIANRLLQAGEGALGRNETPDLLGAQFRAAPAIGDNALTPSATGATAPNKLVSATPPKSLSEPPSAAQAGPMPNVASGPPRSEQERLISPRMTANGVDQTEYVPGSKPTLAEVTGDPGHASDQRFFASQRDTKEQFLARETKNNDARVEYYKQGAGNEQLLQNAIDARATQAEADLKAAWGSKTTANAQPVIDQIDQILAGPAGKESAVDGALTKVRGKLFNKDGQIETDPEILYGVRKEVANLLGKNAQTEQPTLRNAARQLSALKDNLDNQIELGAPGYQQYLANYAQASRPIDSMSLMQDALPGLLQGADKKLTFNGFNRFMKGVVDARSGPGTSPAKSLDDASMGRLWNIYSDLQRQQQAANAGGAKGSDTQPFMSQVAKFAGRSGVNALSGMAFGPAGVAASEAVMAGAGRVLNRNKVPNTVNRLLDGAGYTQP